MEIVAAQGGKAGTVRVTRRFKGKVVGGSPRVNLDPVRGRAVGDEPVAVHPQLQPVLLEGPVPRGIRVTVDDGNGSVRARGFAEPLGIRTRGVSVSVPRDDSSPHTVSADSANGKVTVRTAN
ncbi:hypothetical protein [Streptomyces sp. NBC_00557]|uniref:hypothetical protein n=1 Tax=Streptomyces sp. NBC_00557 TaxID=2975776 RepID=UPI002E82209F|nr:hypothetical protein [Streptomyces sp. NBC_00557]WUC37375.1 hypothetical protein OG956_25745 [Streptomyces sp. NBC_00557]